MKKTVQKVVLGFSAVLALQGCATTPMGPTVQVMPPAGKPFEAFAADQSACKGYAQQQVAGQAESANDRAVGAAVVGAALGAALGGATGGGRGAGAGAAAGGIVGTAVGASGSERTQYTIQQQYNNAYAQCMAAKGNQVAQPVVVHTVVRPGVVYAPPPTVVYTTPPPPPGYAPPPGAGYAPPPGAGYAPPGP